MSLILQVIRKYRATYFEFTQKISVFWMLARSATGMAILGGILIAITYGLARFAFGLFLPAVSDDLSLGVEAAGAIAAAPFASFVGAIVLAPLTLRVLGTRMAAATSCFIAVAGLTAISLAQSAELLVVGLAVCGVSTGISSPIVAHAVHLTVQPRFRARVNSTINAATSLGIGMAVPAVLFFSDLWRSAYQAFGILAVLTGFAALLYLPGRANTHLHRVAKIPGPSVKKSQWRKIIHLSAFAAVTGFVSAIYWVFAPEYILKSGGISAEATAYVWLAVAVGGVLGGAAGDMAARHGHTMSHAFALAVLAASIALLGTNPGHVSFAYGSAAAFGAAYMTLTGFYLVRGILVMQGHPALGPILPLITTASGQIVGAPVAGLLIADSGYQIAFGGFAGLALVTAIFSVSLAGATDAVQEHHGGEPADHA